MPKNKKLDTSRAFSELARKRWDATTKAERSEHGRNLRAAEGSGKPRSAERCPCGANSLKRAEARAFDCCKKSGIIERARK